MNSKPFEDVKIVTIVPEVKKLSHEELHEALMWIEDMLDRSQINFCLIGDMGKQMYDHEIPCFKADKIEIAVMKRHLTESGYSIFKTLVDRFTGDERMIKIWYKNVPIEITIVHNMYPFFMNPDLRCYTITEFKLPNPFKSYWDLKGDIL